MKQTFSQLRPIAIFLGIFFLLSACSQFSDDEGAESLSYNQHKWELEETTSYSMTIQRSCYCPAGFYPAKVLIKADTVYTALNPDTGKPIPVDSLSGDPRALYADFYPTIDGLFQMIKEAREQHADKLEVRYNDAYGYPEHIDIDDIKQAADDEISFTVITLNLDEND